MTPPTQQAPTISYCWLFHPVNSVNTLFKLHLAPIFSKNTLIFLNPNAQDFLVMTDGHCQKIKVNPKTEVRDYYVPTKLLPLIEIWDR